MPIVTSAVIRSNPVKLVSAKPKFADAGRFAISKLAKNFPVNDKRLLKLPSLEPFSLGAVGPLCGVEIAPEKKHDRLTRLIWDDFEG